ncbi:hypothetical protein [Thiohalophilus sp.]|uniref:hypothetical protein n=1 Tax=Thiohalophilus sp. TaxID=3028392 RepID=UPI002ACD64E4|nr:hypothetical protein [Thiohalophilus sp.]MDZ7660966.1 hypothetical protein [Thiohalophilus sp.]
MFLLEYRTLAWWYWLVTVGFLSAGVLGWTPGFHVAIGITVFQLLHFLLREGRLAAFPVQVRLGYLLLVSYDVDVADSGRLLQQVESGGYTAQLVGM